MVKKLNEQVVRNELENSAFFRKNNSSNPQDNRPTKRNNVPNIERSNERTGQRIKIRHTFDIYKDQLTSLHSLQLISLQEKNYKLKLGDMVQEALDAYIQKHTNKPTNERSKEREDEHS